MSKYLVLLEDFPTEDYEGVLSSLRYSKREEYLTLEHRDINSLADKDITKKTAKKNFVFEEIAVSIEEIIRIRDWLNTLDLGDNHSIERKCMSCLDDSEEIHMFKGKFYNEETSEFETEVFCNECLANILTEDPGSISDLEAI